MTHIHGLNSCFYGNCDKKNNIKKKKKENDKGKKTQVRRDSNLGPLSQHNGYTTRPQRFSHPLTCKKLEF